MALTLRNEKGSALTYAELDGNFTYITGSADTVSASLASRVANQEAFSASLDATFATDAQVNAATASLSASISTVRTTLSGSLAGRIAAQEAFSASLDATFATDDQVLAQTASLSASIMNVVSPLSSSFVVLSGSYSNASASLSASISSLSSSFTTLSSSFLAVSSSALTHATTGSNVFSGSQTITGSLNVTGSLRMASGSRIIFGPTGSSITGSRSYETGSIFWNTDSGSWWGFNGNRFIYFVTGNLL